MNNQLQQIKEGNTFLSSVNSCNHLTSFSCLSEEEMDLNSSSEVLLDDGTSLRTNSSNINQHFIDEQLLEANTHPHTCTDLETQPSASSSVPAMEQNCQQQFNLTRFPDNTVSLKGSTGLIKTYKNCKIRWQTCTLCVNDSHEIQSSYKSELVLGAEHCLCAAIKHQWQLLAVAMDNSRLGTVTMSYSANSCSHLQVQVDQSCATSVQESNTDLNAKMIVNGKEYYCTAHEFRIHS